MIDAPSDLLDAGRIKLYCVDSFDAIVVVEPVGPARGARARSTGATSRGSSTRWCRSSSTTRAARSSPPGSRLGAFHAANFALKRADLFPLAICMSGNYDPSTWNGWGERGDAAYFNNPLDYVGQFGGDHLDWLRSRLSLLLVCGQGQWEDTTGSLESTKRLAGLLAEKGIRHELDLWGYDVPHDWHVLARPDRPPSPEVLLMSSTIHLIGLLLGTEEDWPRAFETLLGPDRAGDVEGATHHVTTERITIEPFDLRDKPRYDLVVDRLAWWYFVPREWLKKVALMDDVYLLNSPFTFQAMEKHAAYCAMIRLGIKVPQTVLVPHKNPPENTRFEYTAAKYNQPFDLGAIAENIGYPLFMKPYDGGQWVGRDADQGRKRCCSKAYDESGERLMHLQASVEGFDKFARSLSIGAETMVMDFRPDQPMHNRYAVSHDFLTPETGDEILTISRLINAFFRWEFNSCETLVRGAEAHPIDYANASPDVALTSLHYYWPWAISALLKWSIFCTVTGRAARARGLRHAPLLRDRRPRGPLLRGEAGRVPQAGRRLLRGRRVHGVLRDRARARRRADARLGRLDGVRRAAGRDGPRDLPGARAGAVPRALPRPARPVGARARPARRRIRYEGLDAGAYGGAPALRDDLPEPDGDRSSPSRRHR